MPPILIFEDGQFQHLYPLTYNRCACELPCGTGTPLSRMRQFLPGPVSGLIVRGYLTETVRRRIDCPVNSGQSTREGLLLVNARWLMTESFALPPADTAGISGAAVAWIHLSASQAADLNLSDLTENRGMEALLQRVQRRDAKVPLITYPWDLFDHQRPALLADFARLGAQVPDPAPPGVFLLNPSQMHIGENVRLYPGVVLDAQNGPIIIADDVEIRSHAVITGPVYLGPNVLIRTGADIREDCIIGPGSRVGGEIIGSIFLGHANKQHDGFLGQSIVGEWANLGAGTITSNLKNTYGTVRVAINGDQRSTGRQFVGSIIGDHAKLGIGTCLSTGSVVGFASHVTIPRPPKFVPSFAWATGGPIARADFEKIETIARTVMGRRHIEFTPADHELFVHIANAAGRIERFDWQETADAGETQPG